MKRTIKLVSCLVLFSALPAFAAGGAMSRTLTTGAVFTELADAVLYNPANLASDRGTELKFDYLGSSSGVNVGLAHSSGKFGLGVATSVATSPGFSLGTITAGVGYDFGGFSLGASVPLPITAGAAFDVTAGLVIGKSSGFRLAAMMNNVLNMSTAGLLTAAVGYGKAKAYDFEVDYRKLMYSFPGIPSDSGSVNAGFAYYFGSLGLRAGGGYNMNTSAISWNGGLRFNVTPAFGLGGEYASSGTWGAQAAFTF